MNLTLKSLRRKYNLNQTELAQILGTSQGEVSRIEKGLRKPRPRVADRIRETFGLTAEQIWAMFYEGSDPNARPENLHRP